MSRLAFWFVQSVTVLAVLAPAAFANHIAGATYNGTDANGRAVTLTVTPDGNGISNFNASGPIPGSFCTYSNFGRTYVQPLPITNHTFTDNSGGFNLSGSFPGVQSASGTFRINQGGCDTGNVSWSATTTSQPPAPQPPAPQPPAPQPPAPQPPGGGPPQYDFTGPLLTLGGPRSQKLGRSVAVRASCRDESCRVVARGTLSVPNTARVFALKSTSARLSPGRRATLRLRIGRRARAAARAALRRGRRVRARVNVTAIDAAGNRTGKRRSIRLRR